MWEFHCAPIIAQTLDGGLRSAFTPQQQCNSSVHGVANDISSSAAVDVSNAENSTRAVAGEMLAADAPTPGPPIYMIRARQQERLRAVKPRTGLTAQSMVTQRIELICAEDITRYA